MLMRYYIMLIVLKIRNYKRVQVGIEQAVLGTHRTRYITRGGNDNFFFFSQYCSTIWRSEKSSCGAQRSNITSLCCGPPETIVH